MKVCIWTDNDLDGAGSAWLLNTVFKTADVCIHEALDFEFCGLIRGWFAQHYDEYDKIFISDLNIPSEILSIVDREKVVIIDHHQSHFDVKDQYKQATVIIEVDTSCTNLIRRKFSKVLNNLTLPQEQLISIIDDYDSYKLKYTETLKLNAVYKSYNKPKVDKFIESFSDGIREFNVYELNAISLFFKKYKQVIQDAEFFQGTLKGYKVVSCVAHFAINEVASYALRKYNADIAIIVILDAKAVSFRKSSSGCDIKLNKLAEILCDGGGHEYASGGKLTDNFLKFIQTLTPCIN
jgi:oligoribonuclease NrnB/cAMP/cGMP phosphodiesterase (DHH superfamily)